ncbi:MAG: cytochrome c oxidase subunit II [Bdellovibrionales bacterium]|nr:cytochrome c oxidase subunit II [Bdellovibrionales bacterium]
MEALLLRASSYAADVDGVIHLITLLAGFWFIVAEVVLFYFIFKFRKKNNEKAQYITGEKKEEMKWIHWPHNLIIVCDIVLVFFAIKAWYHIKQELPDPDFTVKITGQQWAWRMQHPGPDKQLDTADDIELVDELRVVVGKTYHYKLESLDVMHSFSVPVFRLKQDAIPGRTITGWFKPTRTGAFDIQCAEMCGIGHGIMGARIIIETEEEHQKWMESLSGNSVAQAL